MDEFRHDDHLSMATTTPPLPRLFGEQQARQLQDQLSQYHNSCVYSDALAQTPLSPDLRHLVSLYRRYGHASQIATILEEAVYRVVSTIVQTGGVAANPVVMIPVDDFLMDVIRVNRAVLRISVRPIMTMSIPGLDKPHVYVYQDVVNACLVCMRNHYLGFFHLFCGRDVVDKAIQSGVKRGQLAQRIYPPPLLDAQINPLEIHL
jgi:hypothetical protein